MSSILTLDPMHLYSPLFRPIEGPSHKGIYKHLYSISEYVYIFLPVTNATLAEVQPDISISHLSLYTYIYSISEHVDIFLLVTNATLAQMRPDRLDSGWRRRSSANKNSVLRKEYRREDQYLSIEMQPYLYSISLYIDRTVTNVPPLQVVPWTIIKRWFE